MTNKIKLYSYSDPNKPWRNRGEDGGISKFAFSYLHGPLEDINRDMIEEKGWEWDAPDLFIPEREPTDEDFIMIETSIQTCESVRVTEESNILWSLSHKDNYGQGELSTRTTVAKTLFAVPCMFYEYDCVAFITRTINKRYLMQMEGANNVAEDGVYESLNRTDYSGRIVIPLYSEHIKWTERCERAEKRAEIRRTKDIWDPDHDFGDETPVEMAWNHAASPIEKQRWM